MQGLPSSLMDGAAGCIPPPLFFLPWVLCETRGAHMAPQGSAVSQPRFIVQDLFPAEEINLIFGPSGVGKTTLTLQILDDWSHDRLVFERESYSAPYCYVACNRSIATLRLTMAEAGLNPDDFPHVSLAANSKKGDHSLDAALILARRQIPNVRVLFLDGMMSLCQEKITDYRAVSTFLIGALQLCQREHITIVGCGTAAKVRDGEGYASPRERLLGSSAWSEVAAAKLFLDFRNPRDPADPSRVLFVMPPSKPARPYFFVFEEGRLELVAEGFECPGALDMWLQSQAVETLTNREILVAAEQMGMERSSVYRWIKSQVDSGTLHREKQGLYRIVGAVRTVQ